MSTFKVTAEPLTILPHPNADALELAQVGLYRAVVPKGVYTTGEYALYIPEQAVLPDDLLKDIGLHGRLAGKDKNRVKAIKLRGEISQGIVCIPSFVDDVDLEDAHRRGQDFAEELGIIKWIPPIPVHMAGEVIPAPDLIRWIDIENIKRYPDIFKPGEEVIATTKLHGSACLYTWHDGESYVSSKGFGSRNQALKQDDNNLYWRAILGHHVPDAAWVIASKLGVSTVGIFGEVYGKGVQDLHYGAEGRSGLPGYMVFDIAIKVDGQTVWLDQDHMLEVLAGLAPAVPRVYEGGYDFDLLMSLAGGKEQISGRELHVNEGIVVRPKNERYSEVLGGRAIAKFVSDAYLTRSGNTTEYE